MTKKRYFLYHLKNRIGYIATVTLIGLIVTLVTLADEHDGKVLDFTDSCFYLPAIVLSITALLSAFMEFAPFLSRRNLDLHYSLPISKNSLYLTHFITGFLSTFIAHLVSFVTVVLFWLPYTEFFDLIYALPLYFISLPCGYAMYVITVFLFTRGNTVIDGILTTALGTFSLSVITAAISETFWSIMGTVQESWVRPANNLLYQFTNWSFFWSPINEFTTYFQYVIEYEQKQVLRFATDSFWYTSIVFGILAIASTIGFFLTYSKKRVETVGEVTNSWFSYRVMIPLYGFCLFTILADFIWVALILAAMLIGYIIYRRSYKLKLSDCIILGCYLLYSTLRVLLD